MKVLLADDSTTMRKIERRTLASMGIEDVVEASNGLEALQKLKELEYAVDLVIFDINMPEMDGLEALKQLRKTPEAAKIPVMMCTSVAEKDQIIKAIKSGANNYVVKPFKPDDLKEKIEKTMGGKI